MTRTRRRLVWAATASEVVVYTAILIGILPMPAAATATAQLILLVLLLAFGGVGALIVTRQPRNAVGWILCLEGAFIALSAAGTSWATLSTLWVRGTLPGTAVLAWVGNWSLIPFILVACLVMPLLFPDGRLPSPRWRPVLAIAIASTGLAVVGRPGDALLVAPLPDFEAVANPFGIPGAEGLTDIAGPIAAALAFVALPLAIAAQVTRFRHGTRRVRQQVKWFAAGCAVPAMLLASSLAVQSSQEVWLITILSIAFLPLAIGFAILRYHLYEIDRIVSRTIGWAIVTGTLVVVFAVGVIGLQAAMTGITNGQTIAVAASTLLAVTLFQPWRRRVQRAVDRRFDRSRYDGIRTSTGFAERLRGEVELTAVRSDLVSTASGSLRPERAAIWLRERR